MPWGSSQQPPSHWWLPAAVMGAVSPPCATGAGCAPHNAAHILVQHLMVFPWWSACFGSVCVCVAASPCKRAQPALSLAVCLVSPRGQHVPCFLWQMRGGGARHCSQCSLGVTPLAAAPLAVVCARPWSPGGGPVGVPWTQLPVSHGRCAQHTGLRRAHCFGCLTLGQFTQFLFCTILHLCLRGPPSRGVFACASMDAWTQACKQTLPNPSKNSRAGTGGAWWCGWQAGTHSGCRRPTRCQARMVCSHGLVLHV